MNQYSPWQAVEHAFAIGRGSLKHFEFESLVHWRRCVPLDNQERDEDWMEVVKMLKAQPGLFRPDHDERADEMDKMADARVTHDRESQLEEARRRRGGGGRE